MLRNNESSEPRVIERPKSIKVLTLSTDRGAALDNWMYGATQLGYDVTVLGLDEKWGGWPWRTKKYLAAVRALPARTLVLIVDGNDILFVRGPTSLYQAYKSVGHPLVFGGEPTCCVGKFAATKLNGERQRAMKTIDARNPINRWKFPNAGCIMGPREVLIEALEGIKDEIDDQAGHLEKYLENDKYLRIDWYHRIVGNVNKPSFFYCVDCSAGDDMNSVELEHWEKVDVTTTEKEFADSIGRTLYRNKVTKGVPCILHFAGKNLQGYNFLGATLYGSAFRPVSTDQAPSVGKSALLHISNLWKNQG